MVEFYDQAKCTNASAWHPNASDILAETRTIAHYVALQEHTYMKNGYSP